MEYFCIRVQAVGRWIRVRELELYSLLMRIADARLVQGMATGANLKQANEAGTGIYRRVGKRSGKDAGSVVSVRGSCEYSPKLGT